MKEAGFAAALEKMLKGRQELLKQLEYVDQTLFKMIAFEIRQLREENAELRKELEQKCKP
jgi:flagellar biosynthesis/type III secretory pathway chaperone